MPKAAKNFHNLSHHRLLTTDMGKLTPCGVVEILPGDAFRQSSSLLLRVDPLVKPLMHVVDCHIHHFFVPARLLFDDWEDFITGKDRELTLPTVTYTEGVSPSELVDHLGIPPAVNQTVNAMPIRAYNMIYNDHYRDQDLADEVSLDSLVLQRVSKEKDYFTTARSDPQLGSASIQIPFAAGTEAPVTGRGGHLTNFDPADNPDWDLGPAVWTSDINTGGVVSGNGPIPADVVSDSTSSVNDRPWQLDADAQAGLVADLSQAAGGGISVNDLRQAMAFQRFYEARNRHGSRYEDLLRYMGISPQDGRLQNPEYLGGGKSPIAFSEVLATAEGTSTSVGDLAGHGIVALRTRPYFRRFPEHGYVISLLNVRPRNMWMQQLHRLWLRTVHTDFWSKEFESMGPQEVFVKEIFGEHANVVDIFGYQGRHDEYRHLQGYVSGAFRTTEADWHLGVDLESAPSLNETFVESNPSNRVFSSQSTPQLYCMINHSIKGTRMVSRRSRY